LHQAVARPEVRRSARSLKKTRQILDAAAAVFREKGYAQATLTDIALAAGTQAGSLYYHFESREHLVEEVLATGMLQTTNRVAAAIAALPPTAATADKIRTGILEHLLQILSHNDYSVAYYKIIDQVPDRVRQKFLQFPRAYAGFWQQLILEGQASGELRRDLDTTVLRLQLLGAIIWSVEWYSSAGRKTPQEIAAQMADVFLTGAAPRPTP
jgi:AcrR family transcriptional regulator